MQTEQQKILWIIFSVALFILVIVGVGVIWFLPANYTKVAGTVKSQANNQAKISFDPYEWAKSKANNYPGLESPPSSQNATGHAPAGQSGQGNSNFTIIYGQQPEQVQSSKAAQPPPQPRASSPPPPAPRPAAPAPPPPAPRASAPPPRPVARAVAPVSKPVAPAPEVTRLVEHWIQVASFTSDFRAERAKKVLGENGIAGRVVTHVVHGKTFFRVRVGPYASQQQAEQFLSQIKKISEFRNSYISLVYGTEGAS